MVFHFRVNGGNVTDGRRTDRRRSVTRNAASQWRDACVLAEMMVVQHHHLAYLRFIFLTLSMFDSEVSFCLLHDDVMSLLQVLVLIVQRLQLAVCRLQLLRQPDSDQRPSKHSAVTMGVYVPLKPTKQTFPISAPSLLPLLPREGGEMGVLNRHLRLHNDVSRATFLFFCIFQIIMYFAFYSSVYKGERTKLPFLSYR